MSMRFPTRMQAVLVLSLAGAGAGCGEDEPPPPPRPSRAAAAAAQPQGGARGGPAVQELPAYRKVEDMVTEAESKLIRHRFKPDDFVNDPSGTASRDPFRSYIIAQVSATPQEPSEEGPAAKTEKCANKKIAASGYSTRELRLIGVISRGTVRFATFADTADVGWVVKRGDCIGSEHARVKLIGEGFVRLEYPGAPVAAGATDPTPRADEREYQLYPKELSTEKTEDEDGELKIRRRPPIRTNPILPAPPGPTVPTVPSGGGGGARL